MLTANSPFCDPLGPYENTNDGSESGAVVYDSGILFWRFRTKDNANAGRDDGKAGRLERCPVAIADDVGWQQAGNGNVEVE